MSSWSLRWRILAEVIVLVVATTVAATIFNVTGAIVVGTIAVIAGGLRARHLSSQFTRLTEGVLRTASFDRSYRLRPEGPFELSRMARAVNRLADRLVTTMREADEERTRLNLILESMAEGVMLIDADGVVEFANPTALDLLGPEGDYEPGVRLVTLNNHYELNDLAGVPAATGESRTAEISLRASSRTVQASATPLDDRDGRRKTVLILTDITAMKQVETTRREFVSNASHELRTPIAAIKASTETLQRGAGDDPAARSDFLDRILEDSIRVERMVTEMLELSRLESGQTLLEIEEINPRELLAEVKDRFDALAARTQTEIRTSTTPEIPLFRADPTRLEQVFGNLVVNAINAMPDGGVIEITADASDESIHFKVQDNGPGIPAAHLPHLFERFYKVDSSRSSGGTGLGLAISRHIVQIHGGIISVDSTVGEGTSFTVVLPTGNPAEEPPSQAVR